MATSKQLEEFYSEENQRKIREAGSSRGKPMSPAEQKLHENLDKIDKGQSGAVVAAGASGLRALAEKLKEISKR